MQPVENGRNFKDRASFIYHNYHFENQLHDAYKQEKFNFEDTKLLCDDKIILLLDKISLNASNYVDD